MEPDVDDRENAMGRYLAIWNGEAGLDDLDDIVTPGYVGHLGSRQRDLRTLKADIAAYRNATPTVRFTVAHRFAEADHVASRVGAYANDADGRPVSAIGLNISRWEGGRLAEEWAVWGAFE